MSNQVIWTDKILSAFIEKAMLNDEEIYIMKSRCQNVPVSAQAMHLHCSESRVHRMIAKLKKKYDAVQLEFPEEFPIRRQSQKELYMDNH